MASLAESLAVEWVESTIVDWAHDTVSEFVWNHDDVDISKMSDVQVENLAREVERIAMNRIVITIE